MSDQEHNSAPRSAAPKTLRLAAGLASSFWPWGQSDEAVVSLAIRSFLFAFLPACLVLAASFVALGELIAQPMEEEIREHTLLAEKAFASMDRAYMNRSRQLVAVLGRNCTICHARPSEPKGSRAEEAERGSLESPPVVVPPRDQFWMNRGPMLQELREWNRMLQADLLVVSDRAGRPVASLIGDGDGIAPEDLSAAFLQRDESCMGCHPPLLLDLGGRLYDVITAPIHSEERWSGTLSVGRNLDASSLNPLGDAAIVRGNRILLTTFPANRVGEIEQQLQTRCAPNREECNIEIGGETFLVLRIRRTNTWGSYLLFHFHSLDGALRPFTRGVRRIFGWVGLGAALLALLVSAVASHSLGRPVADLIAHLRKSEQSGQLQPDFHTRTAVREVNLLAKAFNRAARAVRESEGRLERAMVEFTESLAQAIEARDDYTAGHSDRVSVNSVAIAQVLPLPPDQIETIRVGAKFHDIGKIGIPDAILRQEGALSEEEFALIKLHPQIGKRILEKVGGFQPYLPVVELHHEDYDGSGYPYGLRGEAIPLSARIVHLADIYDALTSDRPYRQAIPEVEALELIRKGRGTQFDPQVMEAFLSLLRQRKELEEILARASAQQG